MINYLEGVQNAPIWKTNIEPSVSEVINKIKKLQRSALVNREESEAISIVIEWLQVLEEQE